MSKDINVTDGTVLETLNNKVDLDGGNYPGSGLEEYINTHRVNMQLFDTIFKDHVLTYEETKGLALQGTYVYKEALAGSRYGYPDFYAKCVEEFNEATNTETVNGVTVKVHSNGHKFYDIADKGAIDTFFGTMGTAWFYGVDTENECVFLPRNNYFIQGTANGSEVGQSVNAGLPNITGTVTSRENSLPNASGAFSLSGTNGSNDYHNSGNTGDMAKSINFKASDSNAIYGKSSTVQPNAVKHLLYICVGNTTSYEGMTEVVNQGMEILEQVNQGVKEAADGQWVSIRYNLAASVTNPTSGALTYDLSSCLPNDGYNYEVLFNMSGTTGASANSYSYGYLATDILTNVTIVYTARVASGASNAVRGAGNAILPVGQQRVVYVHSHTSNTGIFNLDVNGYRRLGTNL